MDELTVLKSYEDGVDKGGIRRVCKIDRIVKLKDTYRFLKFVEIDNEWCVQNRFYLIPIGYIRWSDTVSEYVYYPIPQYWHQQICLSTTNMEDILKFIGELRIKIPRCLQRIKNILYICIIIL